MADSNQFNCQEIKQLLIDPINAKLEIFDRRITELRADFKASQNKPNNFDELLILLESQLISKKTMLSKLGFDPEKEAQFLIDENNNS